MVGGTYTQTAGTFQVAGGNVSSGTALNFQGGLLTGNGTIAAAIMNNAMMQPALAGTGLAITGQCLAAFGLPTELPTRRI